MCYQSATQQRSKNRMRPIPYMKTVLAAVLWVTILPACESEEPVREPIIRPVRTQQVFSTGGTRVRTFAGTAQAGLESRLSFKVAGTVQVLNVKVGDQVKAGALIAELDPMDYRLQVEETEASLERARADLRNAEAKYARVRALYENRNASRDDLDAARAGAESARAQVHSIQKRLELAGSQLRYTRLKAATDGAIAEVGVEVNENVQAGQTVVLLTSGARPEVKVGVPGILISQVQEGGEVEVTFDSIPGTVFRAVVTEVGVVTGMSTVYPVTVRLEEAHPGVRPGMAAEVAFRFGSADDRERFLVPSIAVGEDRNGRYVFVVKPGAEGLGVTHRTPVTVGELREEGIEILEGVSDGDLVVVAGVSKIVDGMTVRLLTERSEGR
jgi:RND family efflux transporter MFP subunit